MKTTNEVIFRTRDLSRVKEQYGAKLGFPVVLEKEGMIGFDTGQQNMYFELGDPNGAVFEMTVEDLGRARDELVALGWEVIEDNPAIPRCYLRDPFGVVFNLEDRSP
jgi:catechol 2,3-dioxygenase-like lactoylglutathione lyase family enzyme